MKKGKVEDIKKYWDNQAILARNATSDRLKILDEEMDVFASSSPELGGTLKDPILRELEVAALCKYIGPNDTILDIGCGNGYTVLEICKRIPGARAIGIDYSEEMIKNAVDLRDSRYSHLRNLVDFRMGNMLNLGECVSQEFSTVITVRTLMNLPSWKIQKAAILEIHKVLKPDGRYLMLEGNVESTQRLNEIREKLNLPPFGSGNWHNLFISDKNLLKFTKTMFSLEAIDHHASTYTLITRTLVHKMQKSDERYSYGSDIYKYAGLLPNHGEYGIQNLHVLRKL